MGKRRRLSLSAFKAEAKDGDPGDCLIAKGYSCEVEKATGDLEGERRLQFTISTGSVDRMADTVAPGGASNLKSFPENGVVLWAHDSDLPPIAKPIKAWRNGEAVKSVAEFTPADLDHPLGRGFGSTVYRYYIEKFMKSVSIGFWPSKWEWSEEEDREWGIDFLKWELLEFSAVPIPANREAVVDLAQKGVDMRGVYDWATKCLDGGLDLIVPRELIEDAHKGLGEIYGTNPTISIPGLSNKGGAADRMAEIRADEAAEIRAELAELRALVEVAVKQDDDKLTPRGTVCAILRAIVAGEAEVDDEVRRLLTAAAETVRAPTSPAPTSTEPTDAEISRAVKEIVKEASDEVIRQYTGEVL